MLVECLEAPAKMVGLDWMVLPEVLVCLEVMEWLVQPAVMEQMGLSDQPADLVQMETREIRELVDFLELAEERGIPA